MLPLFDDPPPSFNQRGLAAKLSRLASEGIYIGTSSWKYEGWLGQIYSPDRYSVRGRFSRKRFDQECLSEYAETFPIVCGDFSFYQFPSDAFWEKLFTSAPRQLRFAFKVPEEITVKSFPVHPRYGARAGQENQSFLNPEIFQAGFADPLARYQPRVPLLIFEFGAFSRRAIPDGAAFAARLEPFLAALPQHFRYAVEIRNPDFLDSPYFHLLRRHKVAHVFNAWSKMPEIHAQMAHRDAFTADFTVSRALLRHGRLYEDAVAAFSPYTKIQDENPQTRAALKGLIQRSKARKESSYIFVNNRLEGNAPRTIEAIVD